jgi:hypothetical protein
VRPWQSGDFDRKRINRVLHPLAPAHAADSLHQVDLQRLWDRGKRLILIDVDNTLVQWKAENFAQPVLDWLAQAKQMGFNLCIISNTNRLDRLARLSELLGIETVRGRFKPSRAMFRLAMIKFKCKPEQTIMIGDQLFTDVLGANRSGIEAVWVRKMEGREFGPTSISRFMERLVTGSLYKSMVAPIDESPYPRQLESAKPLPEKTIVHQIVKFCIVGGTSFVIDTGLTIFLMEIVQVGGTKLSTLVGGWVLESIPFVANIANTPEKASAPILGGMAALVAMFNSFVWNRKWTFEVRGREERLAQLRRFYLVSILGAVISTAIFSLVYNAMPDHSTRAKIIAKVVAAGIAAVWNFMGQRMYAFRSSRS